MIASDLDISFYMYFHLISCTAALNSGGHAIVAVDDLNILIAQILIISIDKTIIPAFHSVVFDAIPAHDIDLHAVVRHKTMAAPAQDPAGGIVKQIIKIEDKEIR